MSTMTSYLTAAETLALLTTLLPSTDPRRKAYAALSEADRAVCCTQASTDLDAVAYVGRPSTDTQTLAWPRVIGGDHEGLGRSLTLTADPGPTAGEGVGEDWTLAGVPIQVRRAQAVQAARRAVTALGQDDQQERHELAAGGVTGYSGAGRSVTMAAGRANDPVARIDPDALRYVQILVRTTGEIR